MMPSLTCPILGLWLIAASAKPHCCSVTAFVTPARAETGCPQTQPSSCEIDKPGKDSYVLHHAGAAQTLIASAKRTVVRIRHIEEPNWAEAHPPLSENADLILAGGA
ncbi:MAG: molybdopterin-guanine dinucleotide biosynthesis protein MobB [Candidatus Competibacteraceae bacterium]